jgi:peptidoglycan/LPS O-acetylase OafA/YrhL
MRNSAQEHLAKPGPSYRPEVDGLRAVAVISVILFHAKVSLFSGGFVGVDVFFVISGFLITGLLMNDANNGEVSISRFYERRIRRILPALTVVAFCTLVAGCVLFLPAQLIALGKSILATSVFSSNIWFWNQTDYFDPSSEMMPLLHTWSLAVEEHFYIVFPLLIALLCRRPRLLVLVIVALATASLVLCAMQTSRSPAAAFYLLPTRAWELLVGALVALLPLKTPPTLGEASSAIGLVLIVGSIFLMNEAMSFPGVYAVAPVAGAALVIVGGKRYKSGPAFGEPAHGVGRTLELFPVSLALADSRLRQAARGDNGIVGDLGCGGLVPDSRSILVVVEIR